ncbi:MAG: SBBP repeat-containing protein [Phycisphaerales bacterium]|nr:SBBP repeat-containing protein [Phycisphaerales bacterium]
MRTGCIALLVVQCGLPLAATGQELTPAEPARAGVTAAGFAPNQGQWPDAQVLYALRARGLDVALRESSLTLHMRPPHAPGGAAAELAGSQADGAQDSGESAQTVIAVSFPGSHRVEPVGEQPLDSVRHYFVGGAGRNRACNVRSYSRIVYPNLYDGVDLYVTEDHAGILKYEFHVAPGSDWSQIRIAYDGVGPLCIDGGGNLVVETALGSLADTAPMAWQQVDGSRVEVRARFHLADDRTCSIMLEGPVDATRDLIIDPTLEWMVYVGGAGYDYIRSVVTDDLGNAYIAGVTESIDFEGRRNSFFGGYTDAFVSKLTPSGELAWTAYLGGTADDDAEDIATDGLGSIHVCGSTISEDFDGRINAMSGNSDAFLVKLNSEGQLLWMTYVGGTYTEQGIATAATADGAFVAGWTISLDLPGKTNDRHGGYDGFVTSIRPDGTVRWATYLGGENTDTAAGLGACSDGGVAVTGWTNSADLEGRINHYHGGSEDAFLAMLDGEGAIDWATYLGGARTERGSRTVIDGEGNTFVAGNTTSDDFEGRNNEYSQGPDGFVLKLQPGGAVEWMTYLGGQNSDYAHAITLDPPYGILVAGKTDSEDFDGRMNSFFGGFEDAFLLTLDTRGESRSMVFLGGFRDESANGIAPGLDGHPVIAGNTDSRDFIGRTNSYRGGLSDGFVLRVSLNRLSLSVSATCPKGGSASVAWSGATPDSRIALLFARDTGLFVIPNGRPCAGTVLGLGETQLRVVYIGSSGPTGARTLFGEVGPEACGGYLQLLDLATCRISGVAPVQ